MTVLEVRGGAGGVSKDAIRELWLFREVLWAFTVRHVKVKYKQAAVGIGWAVIQPVLTAALFTLFLGRLARVPSDGVPYALLALTGMVFWTYFSTATGSAMASLVTDAALLRKVYFPREVLPLASLAAAIVDLIPGLLIVLLAAVAFGFQPDVTWLALPIPLVLLVLSAAALGLGLSALNVYYRDVRYTLPFLLQLGIIASPVMYSATLVPTGWRWLYLVANPLGEAIDGFRRILLHHSWPNLPMVSAAAAWSFLLILAGYILFKRLERGFTDRI